VQNYGLEIEVKDASTDSLDPISDLAEERYIGGLPYPRKLAELQNGKVRRKR
jgi:hypothetical protein